MFWCEEDKIINSLDIFYLEKNLFAFFFSKNSQISFSLFSLLKRSGNGNKEPVSPHCMAVSKLGSCTLIQLFS